MMKGRNSVMSLWFIHSIFELLSSLMLCSKTEYRNCILLELTEGSLAHKWSGCYGRRENSVRNSASISWMFNMCRTLLICSWECKHEKDRTWMLKELLKKWELGLCLVESFTFLNLCLIWSVSKWLSLPYLVSLPSKYQNSLFFQGIIEILPVKLLGN